MAHAVQNRRHTADGPTVDSTPHLRQRVPVFWRYQTLVALVHIAVTLGATAAGAQDSQQAQEARATASMSWAFGPCGPWTELEARVEAQLERQVFVAREDARLHITGHIARQGDRVLARFELFRGTEPAGTRELLAADCTELARALPIVIALTVDLEAQGAQGPQGPQQAARLVLPTPEEAARSPRVDAPPTNPEPEPALAFSLRAGAAVDLGLLPSPAYSARVALRLEGRSGPPFELRAAFIFPSSSLDDEGRGILFWGGLAALATCPRLVSADALFLLEACGGVDGGIVVVHGRGFLVNHEAISPLFDLFAGLRAGLRFTHVALSLEAALTVPLPSTQFTVTRTDGTEAVVAAGDPVGARIELTIATMP